MCGGERVWMCGGEHVDLWGVCVCGGVEVNMCECVCVCGCVEVDMWR